mmetsp:Transcript_5521/g.11353  ORF Transcript_5521/g.11353 Transcript_5521/m.11353 type:complete len:94 (+) Transcript_5521:478-759(+)
MHKVYCLGPEIHYCHCKTRMDVLSLIRTHLQFRHTRRDTKNMFFGVNPRGQMCLCSVAKTPYKATSQGRCRQEKAEDPSKRRKTKVERKKERK